MNKIGVVLILSVLYAAGVLSLTWAMDTRRIPAGAYRLTRDVHRNHLLEAADLRYDGSVRTLQPWFPLASEFEGRYTALERKTGAAIGLNDTVAAPDLRPSRDAFLYWAPVNASAGDADVRDADVGRFADVCATFDAATHCLTALPIAATTCSSRTQSRCAIGLWVSARLRDKLLRFVDGGTPSKHIYTIRTVVEHPMRRTK